MNIRSHPEGAVLEIRVQPGARRNALIPQPDGSWRVALSAPAQGGRANAALLDHLAEWLCLRPGQLALLRGQTHRHKAVLIRGLTAEEVRQRLSAHAG